MGRMLFVGMMNLPVVIDVSTFSNLRVQMKHTRAIGH